MTHVYTAQQDIEYEAPVKLGVFASLEGAKQACQDYTRSQRPVKWRDYPSGDAAGVLRGTMTEFGYEFSVEKEEVQP